MSGEDCPPEKRDYTGDDIEGERGGTFDCLDGSSDLYGDAPSEPQWNLDTQSTYAEDIQRHGVTYMSPQEYFDILSQTSHADRIDDQWRANVREAFKTPSGERGNPRASREFRHWHDYKRVSDLMHRGTPMTPAYLDVDLRDGKVGQEGGHRAALAEMLGIDSIPVVVRPRLSRDALEEMYEAGVEIDWPEREDRPYDREGDIRWNELDAIDDAFNQMGWRIHPMAQKLEDYGLRATSPAYGMHAKAVIGWNWDPILPGKDSRWPEGRARAWKARPDGSKRFIYDDDAMAVIYGGPEAKPYEEEVEDVGPYHRLVYPDSQPVDVHRTRMREDEAPSYTVDEVPDESHPKPRQAVNVDMLVGILESMPTSISAEAIDEIKRRAEEYVDQGIRPFVAMRQAIDSWPESRGKGGAIEEQLRRTVHRNKIQEEREQPPRRTVKPPESCPSCGSHHIARDYDRDDFVCETCGEVLDDDGNISKATRKSDDDCAVTERDYSPDGNRTGKRGGKYRCPDDDGYKSPNEKTTDERLSNERSAIKDSGSVFNIKTRRNARDMVARKMDSVYFAWVINSWMFGDDLKALVDKYVNGEIDDDLVKQLKTDIVATRETYEGDTVKLYRGLSPELANIVSGVSEGSTDKFKEFEKEYEAALAQGRDYVRLKRNDLESWSESETVAKSFAKPNRKMFRKTPGYVLEVEMPKESVLLSYKTAPLGAFQREVLTVSRDGYIDVPIGNIKPMKSTLAATMAGHKMRFSKKEDDASGDEFGPSIFKGIDLGDGYVETIQAIINDEDVDMRMETYTSDDAVSKSEDWEPYRKRNGNVGWRRRVGNEWDYRDDRPEGADDGVPAWRLPEGGEPTSDESQHFSNKPASEMSDEEVDEEYFKVYNHLGGDEGTFDYHPNQELVRRWRELNREMNIRASTKPGSVEEEELRNEPTVEEMGGEAERDELIDRLLNPSFSEQRNLNNQISNLLSGALPKVEGDTVASKYYNLASYIASFDEVAKEELSYLDDKLESVGPSSGSGWAERELGMGGRAYAIIATHLKNNPDSPLWEELRMASGMGGLQKSNEWHWSPTDKGRARAYKWVNGKKRWVYDEEAEMKVLHDTPDDLGSIEAVQSKDLETITDTVIDMMISADDGSVQNAMWVLEQVGIHTFSQAFLDAKREEADGEPFTDTFRERLEVHGVQPDTEVMDFAEDLYEEIRERGVELLSPHDDDVSAGMRDMFKGTKEKPCPGEEVYVDSGEHQGPRGGKYDCPADSNSTNDAPTDTNSTFAPSVFGTIQGEEQDSWATREMKRAKEAHARLQEIGAMDVLHEHGARWRDFFEQFGDYDNHDGLDAATIADGEWSISRVGGERTKRDMAKFSKFFGEFGSIDRFIYFDDDKITMMRDLFVLPEKMRMRGFGSMFEVMQAEFMQDMANRTGMPVTSVMHANKGVGAYVWPLRGHEPDAKEKETLAIKIGEDVNDLYDMAVDRDVAFESDSISMAEYNSLEYLEDYGEELMDLVNQLRDDQISLGEFISLVSVYDDVVSNISLSNSHFDGEEVPLSQYLLFGKGFYSQTTYEPGGQQ